MKQKKTSKEIDADGVKEKPPDENLINHTMKWVNLFGSNVDLAKSGKHSDSQNEDIEKATTFKGRVLIEYFVYDVKHPEMKVMDIPKCDTCK